MSHQQKLIYHTTEERVDSHQVVEAFNKLAQHKVPERPAAVVLDNASVRNPLSLSSAHSPELNLIEILWRKVKYEWLPVNAYDRFDGLKTCVENVLSKFGQEYQICFS